MSAAAVGVAGFLLGIALASLVPVPWAGAGLAALLGAVFLAFWFWKKAPLYLSAGILMLLAALGIGRTLLAPSAPPDAFAPLIGVPGEMDGVVVADPDIRETSQRLTVEVGKDGATTRILVVAPSYPAIRYGDHIEAYGTLAPPAPFDTDGGRVFRYDRFLAKDGVFAVMNHASVSITGPRSGLVAEILGSFSDAKRAFIGALDIALPEPESSLAAGILVGGKQGLGALLIAAFTATGMLQIVVLSGYNVMIVAEAVRRLLGFLPKRAALILAGLAIAAFVLAAGAGASAVRAGIMAGVALFARATGRKYAALRALFAAVVLMLILNPLLLAFDPGFELSVVATLGLILLSPHIESRLGWIRSGFLRDIVATTAAAQIFVLPLLVWQTGNLSLVSFAANVLAMPVIPLAMFLSFVAALAGFIVPVLAPLVALPAHAALSYIIAIAEFGAQMPFANVIIPAFPFWLTALCYGALAYFVCRAPRPRARGSASPRPPN